MAREDELLRQIQKGRHDCLDELVELYYPAILRYCMWHMPDRESAQDATQETFLKLVRFIDRYHHRGQFKAFLYRIASNTCIDIMRKNSASVLSIEAFTDLPLSVEPLQESGFQAAEDRQQLAMLLTGLGPEARELVLLRYGQELTLREISAITGLPLRTVQTKLRRAINKMKEASENEKQI